MTRSDIELPNELRGLVGLALDLRWTWYRELDEVWRRINPEIWAATRNPWFVLRSAGRSALEVLARDAAFVATVRACVDKQRTSAKSGRWFARAHQSTSLKSIAYFSMEYGISESLPMYAGGLGVLAGDYLKAASDLGVPVVGVGLLYQRGYFRQALDANGAQLEFYPSCNPGDMPIVPVLDDEGAPLQLRVPFPGRTVNVRAWHARVGRVSLYLLDTNDPENGAEDRGITAELYGGGPDVRLRQEMILGIGGWRLLGALGIAVDVCHLNEGHAAFAVLERAHALMTREGVSFAVALAAARPGNIFTTHTPVAAGFDRFEPQLIERYLRPYARELGVALETILALGGDGETDSFMPAYLAMRASGAVNAVSRRHGEVSRALFAGMFPRWPLADVPVGFVTNGVHTPSWDSQDADRVWTQACGKDRWRGDLAHLEVRMATVEARDLWGMRRLSRARLVAFVRERLAQQLREAGAPDDRVESASRVLDPEALTIGFARRFATYKRATLLLADQERLVRLLTSSDRPVQLVIAGKAHPADAAGKAMIQAWTSFVRRPEIRDHAVFLSDYDLVLAEELVHGVDLWLNTPQPPWEASGTSGMKVLVNGGLNCSELDGWWVEAYAPRFGWAIETGGNGRSDAAAAQVLYERLEAEIIPAFYTRNAAGVPQAWVDRMRASMAELAPAYSTNRMIREYVERYYLSAADAIARRTADRCALAQRLVAWQDATRGKWPGLRFGAPRISTTGDVHRYELPCYFGELDPGDVTIELYADGSNTMRAQRYPMLGGAQQADGSILYRAQVTTERNIADFTARAVPNHPEAIVPLEAAEITWQR